MANEVRQAQKLGKQNREQPEKTTDFSKAQQL